MSSFEQFFTTFSNVLVHPSYWLIILLSSLLGIIFGALPGLTATLGIALLTSLTYGMDLQVALMALLSLYVGAIYGGSYPSILLNIPGTAAAAASSIEGYPLALQGRGGEALGLTTTASAVGTLLGLLVLLFMAPLIASLSLKFTSIEFFLLAIFGIVLSGSLTSDGNILKGWIAGLIGLGLSCVGRDQLDFIARFTFGNENLDMGISIIPFLIGVFGIPQIITAMTGSGGMVKASKISSIRPKLSLIARNGKNIIRSSFIGVGVGAVPGVGEDIASWVSYSAEKNAAEDKSKFGKGAESGLIATETANNACIGGALIPLLSLGIPGSAPAAMLLGALMLHGVTPGPGLTTEKPEFLISVISILILATIAMYINGIVLAKQVVKLLSVPVRLFMPLVAVLCVLGAFALGLNIFNLYIMLFVGIMAFIMQKLDYPVSPLVIGLILGPMADVNLRRALLTSGGDLTVFLSRPVSLILLVIIFFFILRQLPFFNRKFRV